MGHTFLAFTHVGRRTGQPHQTVAMVLRYDKASGEASIVSAWGPQTDWYLNLQRHPAVRVQLGGQTFTPQQRFLSEEEAFDVAVQFRREHPHRMRLASRILGWGDLRDDARLRNSSAPTRSSPSGQPRQWPPRTVSRSRLAVISPGLPVHSPARAARWRA